MIVKRTRTATKGLGQKAKKFFDNKIVPTLNRLIVDEEEAVVKKKFPKNGIDLALFSNKRK